MSNLSKVNFMSKSRFDTLSNTNTDELYLVEQEIADDTKVVHIADTETVTGNKTFSGTTTLAQTNVNKLKITNTSTTKQIEFAGTNNFITTPSSGNIYFDTMNSTTISDASLAISTTSVYSPNYSSLGTSTYKWKDLYISGNLTDGTNSTTLSNLMTTINNKEDKLPTYERGKYLSYNGLKLVWADAAVFPSQTSNAGKFLTTDGSVVSWSDDIHFKYYKCHNDNETNKFYKMGEIVLSGTYNTQQVQFMLQDGSARTNKQGLMFGEIVVRVEDTAGTLNTSSSGILFNNKLNSTVLDNFRLYYTNNYDTNKVLVEFWISVPESYTGYSFSVIDTISYTQTRTDNWFFYDGVQSTAFPTTTYISATMCDQTPAASSSTTERQYATVGWTNNPSLSTNVVHRSGDETIAGTKTFSDNPYITKDTPQLLLRNTNTNADVTTNPSVAINGPLISFRDKNDVPSGFVYTRYETNGMVKAILQANKTINGTDNNSNITVGVDASGNHFSTAPTPTEDTTSSTQIDTVGARNTKLGNYVDKTSAQDISGKKTFTANHNTYTGMSSPITFKNNNVEQMTVPSAYSEQMLYCTDKNDVRIANYGGAITANGASRSYIAASKLIDSSYKYCTVNTYVNTDGSTYADVSSDYFTFPRCTTAAGTTSTAASNRVAVIVTNYKDGTNWYRIWSDGWIEQGGRNSVADDGTLTLTFLKAYSDTNYIVTAATHCSNYASTYAIPGFINKTTTTVQVCGMSNGMTTTFDWYAQGY